MNRKIAAHYLFTGVDKPIKNGIVTIDEAGKILEISQSAENLQEIAGLEFYSGILVPGFVNVHCHVELSHMQGIINQHTGLPGFVSNLTEIRQADEDEILKAAKKADVTMQNNGIVAVGDICNTNHSFQLKIDSKIKYHSFLEVFTINRHLVNKKFELALQLEKELQQFGLSSSIVPHAPYSVTSDMFQLIKEHSDEGNQITCIHNQECPSENELYQSHSGELYDVFSNMGVDFSSIPETGKNSLESVMTQMPQNGNTLLVHNTYSTTHDVEKASGYFKNLFWCFCPNANLYIENQLPTIPLFIKKQQKMCIGTDSLASNHQLSVLDELKTIQQNFPQVLFEELIKWATINGAQALNIHDTLGSIELGKKPGINLVSNFDIKNFCLKEQSRVKSL